MKNLVEYIKSLMVTQGQGAGMPFEVLPWEKRFLTGAFKPAVLTAALSVARGNGKTCLISSVATAALDGPLRQNRGEVVIVASSFSQARIAFEHCKSFLQPKIDANPDDWSVQDSANVAKIKHKPSGATLKAIGSDPRRAHGLAPTLALLDEPAQWEQSKADKMLAAITTAMGKIPGSRVIALGTRPSDDSHWFAKWLNGGADYAQVHAASPDDKPTLKSTWKKANPSLPFMPSLEAAIRNESKKAKIDDSVMQSFRALRLNQGVADTGKAVVLEANTWRAYCETDVLPKSQGKSIWGVDLGSGAAMSAVAAYEPISGRLEVIAAFPTMPDLKERGAKDSVGDLYVQMRSRGELAQIGGRTTDITELIELALGEFGIPESVCCDRWRQSELEDALDAAGLTNVPVVLRGMGFRDGGDDMRRFRRAAVEGAIRTPVSLLMRSAIAGAAVVSDPAGNAKLAKARDTSERRDGHRDDSLAAAILAIGEGVRNPPATRSNAGYRGYV